MGEYTIGLDFGSLSCRGVLADCSSGKVLAESESIYSRGAITCNPVDGSPLPSGWVLQDPSDYEEALFLVLRSLVEKSKVPKENILGIGVDSTASTVIPVDASFRPLCQNPKFRGHLHSWPKMWKYHAANKENEDINSNFAALGILDRYGGSSNSEFLLPKVLQCFREDRQVFDSAYTFIELGEWITSLLVGRESRSVSYLKSKAFWDSEKGFVEENSLDLLGEGFGKAFLSRMQGSSEKALYPWEPAGTISDDIALKTGLLPSTIVATAEPDGYAGVLGCGIYKPGTLMMVFGTSTGLMALDAKDRAIKGMCASLKDVLIKDLTLHAAGQAGTGDMLGWFVSNMVPARYENAAKEKGMNLHEYLSSLARQRKSEESRLLAIDWFNGNKSILADTSLSGTISGLNLETRPEDIYRALVESAAFGSRLIIETMVDSGVEIDGIVASGGIATRNPMFVKIQADVLGMPIGICDSDQAAALGSAILASVASGLHEDVASATKAMGGKTGSTVFPDEHEHRAYENLYREYRILHDYLGRSSSTLMKTLYERKRT